MPANGPEAARRFHAATLHTPERVRAGGHVLDWSNLPLPFKVYPDLEPVLLPLELPQPGSAAVEALSGRRGDGGAELDVGEVARLAFLSAGVTRRVRLADGRPMFFRAAPSAGALYPVEVYLVCAGVAGLDDGVYHFGPVEFGLRRLRSGDHREVLAAATADAGVGDAPLSFVLAGIPWRTTWKYRDRGYRHLFWDAGVMAGNLLAACDDDGLDGRVLLGFVDRDVDRLLDLGEPEEWALVVVPVNGAAGPAAPSAPEAASAPQAGDVTVEQLGLRVYPLSMSQQDFPLVRETHHAGSLEDRRAVKAWREQGRSAAWPRARSAPPPPGTAPRATLEEVVLMRGSTRRFARVTLGAADLEWPLAVAGRPVAADAVVSGTTLLEHLVVVHGVEGVEPGAYLWGDERRLVRRGELRAESSHLCLDQPLGGDSAYTVFLAARLDRVLGELGTRGYRAAQFEAGVAAGRLHLAAYALGLGATGLTFYDEEVRAFFGVEASPMLAVAVGTPAYRARPGARPSEVQRLRIELADG